MGVRAATPPSPNPVNYNTKSMSRSSRLHEMVPFSPNPVIYNTKSTFWTIPTKLGLGWARAVTPKRFLAINCTICLHFQIRDRGSAWFFGAHLFVFWSRGPIFGPRNPNLDLGFGNLARAGPGRFWRQTWGLEKPCFEREWFRNRRLWDFPRPKWIVWYPGGLWESQFPPKPL